MLQALVVKKDVGLTGTAREVCDSVAVGQIRLAGGTPRR